MSKDACVFFRGDSVSKSKAKRAIFPEMIPPAPFPCTPARKETKKEIALRKHSDEVERLLDLQDLSRAVAREMESVLQRLEKFAFDGDEEAMESLYIVAARAIRALEQSLKKHPTIIKRLAGQQIVWPAMISSKPDITKKNTEHIPELSLGKYCGIKLTGSKWNYGNTYTTEAFWLFRQINSIRGIGIILKQIKSHNPPETYLMSQQLLAKIAPEKHQFIDKLVLLPDLSKTTLRKYRDVLKELFLQKNPIPEKMDKFFHVRRHENRGSDSAKREKIFGLVMQALKSVLLP